MTDLQFTDDRPMDVFSALCPSRDAFRNVTGRWGSLVLMAIEGGATRFGDIRRSIGGLSERMLSQTLTSLTDDGFVVREEDDGGRPVYALSPGGSVVAAKVRELRDTVYGHLEERQASHSAEG